MLETLLFQRYYYFSNALVWIPFYHWNLIDVIVMNFVNMSCDHDITGRLKTLYTSVYRRRIIL